MNNKVKFLFIKRLNIIVNVVTSFFFQANDKIDIKEQVQMIASQFRYTTNLGCVP